MLIQLFHQHLPLQVLKIRIITMVVKNYEVCPFRK